MTLNSTDHKLALAEVEVWISLFGFFVLAKLFRTEFGLGRVMWPGNIYQLRWTCWRDWLTGWLLATLIVLYILLVGLRRLDWLRYWLVFLRIHYGYIIARFRRLCLCRRLAQFVLPAKMPVRFICHFAAARRAFQQPHLHEVRFDEIFDC